MLMMNSLHLVKQVVENILTPEQIKSVLYYVVNEGETADYKQFFASL